MAQSYRPKGTVLSRVMQWLVLIYQAVAIVVFVASIIFGLNWINQPFIGGFFEQTLVLNGVNTTKTDGQWALYAEGFTLGDQLKAIGDDPITDTNDLEEALGSLTVEDTIPVTINLFDGGERTANIPLQRFPRSDQISYFILPATLSFIFLIISLWIFGLRRSEPAGRAFSVMTSSLAIVIGTLFDLYTTHRFTYLWTMAAALAAGAIIDLALGFPQEARVVIGRPYLRWIGYVIGVALALYAYTKLYDFQNPTAYFKPWQNIYVFVGLSGLFYFGALAYNAFFSYSPVVKNQARTILYGSLVAFGPIVFWLLYSSLLNIIDKNRVVAFSPYFFLPTVLFPLVNGYVILRFRLLQTDYWLRQGTVYSILTVLVVIMYGLLVSGLGLILPMPSDNPYLVGALVFIIAIFLEPIRTRLQTLVDSTFFRGQRAFDERLRIFSHQLTNAPDLNTISRVLREQIGSSLVPDRMHVYTYDSVNDQYAALNDENNRPTSDVRFSSTGPLVQYFQKESIPLYLDTINPPSLLKGDEARLSLLGARLFVALDGDERPVGWLALGNPLSGSMYSPKDLDFLNSLADQASVAISRVQTVADLERRVQEMNALTRVSQGVNITPTFDDILELIFAQATQIIPSSLFHITLYNKAANYFYYAFCVDDNDRIHTRENLPLPSSLGLGSEIIRKGRQILTQDYTRECQS
ncbi:MAG TPA: hypothetical protein VFQ23_08135, partial [Anaerolineales bacterium]|nr:hypothetical protein [Anaerolineales bacterium]